MLCSIMWFLRSFPYCVVFCLFTFKDSNYYSRPKAFVIAILVTSFLIGKSFGLHCLGFSELMLLILDTSYFFYRSFDFSVFILVVIIFGLFPK